MIVTVTLEVKDLKHSIDFVDAKLEDFNIDLRLIRMADIVEFINDEGAVIKEFKNRF
jgi:hypothetical protein